MNLTTEELNLTTEEQQLLFEWRALKKSNQHGIYDYIIDNLGDILDDLGISHTTSAVRAKIYRIREKIRRYEDENDTDDGLDVTAFLRDYSSVGGRSDSARVLAAKYGITIEDAKDLLKENQVKKDTLPFTDEDLDTKTTDELSDELARHKKRQEIEILTRQKVDRNLRRDANKWRNFDESVLQYFKAKLPTVNYIKTDFLPQKRLVIDTRFCDFHYGEYSEGTSKYLPYNMDIADQYIAGSRQFYFEKFKEYNPETVLLPLMGDSLHIDNMQATTTAGTPQDIDSSVEQIIERFTDMIHTEMLFLGQNTPDLHLILTGGNHDRFAASIVFNMLKAQFSSWSNITFHNTGNEPRYYYKYGSNLIALGHGDKESKAELKTVIPNEAPEMWGATKKAFWIGQHIHHETLLQDKRTLYMTPGCLSGGSKWSIGKAYSPFPSSNLYMFEKSGRDRLIHTYTP